MKADLFKVGDVGGTTAKGPFAWIIKAKIWGLRYMFSADKCNHTFTVIRLDRDILDRNNLVILKNGDLCIAEMGADGVDLKSFDEYFPANKNGWYVFISRHPAFSQNITAEGVYSNFILGLRDRHIKYGWEDILREEAWIDKRIKDNPDTLICNELPREGFKRCGIPYPESFDTPQFSPKDWQLWSDMIRIEKEILC